MRATSTAADVTVFVLVVSVAVATLALPVERPPAGTATDVTTALLTSTADLRHGSPSPALDAGTTEYRAHGSVAGLLAAAAVANATVAGTEVVADGGFERGVKRATRNATRDATDAGTRVAVRAIWRPVPGDAIAGRVRVGPRPPPSTDVHATTVRLDSGLSGVTERATAAAADGRYDGLARTVADSVVAGFLPPEAMGVALRDEDTAPLARARYRRFADATDAPVDTPADGLAVPERNRRLSRSLATTLAPSLRNSTGSPRAAGDGIAVGDVRITVRTWSP